jgi:GAF domain-containing protein
MVYRAATGPIEAHLGLRLPMKNSISGLCVQSHDVLYSEDTEQDTRVNKEACRKVAARSLVVAPLFYEGKTVGVLKIIANFPHAFNEDNVKTLELMAGLIGSALAHQIYQEEREKLLNERTQALEALKKAEETLRHMAGYDDLTDLSNRRLFMWIP